MKISTHAFLVITNIWYKSEKVVVLKNEDTCICCLFVLIKTEIIDRLKL